MGAERRLHVICYDITSDAARRRVADLLEESAVRVQGSVFEARLTEAAIRRLAQRAAALLGPGDSLRIYAVPHQAIRACREWGHGAPIEEQDFYLL